MENLEEILSRITAEQGQIEATYDAEEKQWEERKKELKRQIKDKKLEGIKHKLKYLESLSIDDFEHYGYGEVRIDFLSAEEAWILAEFLLENAEPQMVKI